MVNRLGMNRNSVSQGREMGWLPRGYRCRANRLEFREFVQMGKLGHWSSV